MSCWPYPAVYMCTCGMLSCLKCLLKFTVTSMFSCIITNTMRLCVIASFFVHILIQINLILNDLNVANRNLIKLSIFIQKSWFGVF